MKLYYAETMTTGYGTDTVFVLAESIEEAVEFINESGTDLITAEDVSVVELSQKGFVGRGYYIE